MIPELLSGGGAPTLRACRTNKFKTAMLTVSTALPITKENACLAPLMLSVLRRGTEKYPTIADLNRRLDYLWGTGFSIRSSYKGNLQILSFSAEMVDGAYLPEVSEDLTMAVLELLEQILFHPILDASGLLSARYVESEKELQRDAIRAAKNRPRSYAIGQCKKILYEGDPCGFPLYGSESETMAVTPSQLTDYWRRWREHFSPDCFYVGSEDPTLVQEKLAAVFGKHLTAEGQAERSIFVSHREGREILKSETLPVAQSQLIVGLRSPENLNRDGYYAAAVMNEMLGGSPISKLFVNVREKKSLCYSCSSSFYSFAGVLLVDCGIKRENREAAEREIKKQIRDLAEGRFSVEELEAAKKSLGNACRQMEDSPGELEGSYYSRALAENGVTADQTKERFYAVSREEIMAAARDLSVDVIYFLEGTDDAQEEDDDGEEI